MAPTKDQHKELIAQLDTLHNEAVALEEKHTALVQQAHPNLRKSAANLLHYLALRQHDIRELQEQLAELGLSSLGRAEGHVLASIRAVRNQLCQLADCQATTWKPALSFVENNTILAAHTAAMLGQKPENRDTRIMVTFSTELASNYNLVCRLLQAGMNCARINCAHDNPETWLRMIRNIRQAEKEMGIPCKVLMDLMGPKLRTGALTPGPQLVFIQPVQDVLGKTTAPVNVWLAPADAPSPTPVDAALPVDTAWLDQLQQGDTIAFKDTRGRKRKFSVVYKYREGVIVHLLKSSYIATGTTLTLQDGTAKTRTTQVGNLPALQIPIILHPDHLLELTREPIPGEPARYDANGHIVKPGHISCTLPEVFEQTEVGQPILFDDGKIEGRIQKITKEKMLVKITYASAKGSKLKADSGINLPESKLDIRGLTAKDKEDLAFVAAHADIVNLSFVNNAAMVEALHAELDRLNATALAVMLKVETKEGFRNLPDLLLTAMRRYPTGIMIARGDLAVECGWERLAEVQEEILWLCEAAHIPVVWATQVLESLAKKGRPSRAEITDAAMSQRADCVMLNKGPHVVQAIELLVGILTRMQEHQHKKTSMLRMLQVSDLSHKSDTAEQS